jgi:glycosyltransferase involved in cell wall biosynthesis
MSVSVVIATRDRPLAAARAVASVLACQHPTFEVVVVDQSANEESRHQLESLGDERIRYFRSQPGLSRARNLGWRQARHPLIAFTDDDCLVGPDWLSEFEAVFHSQPRVGLAFGNVLPGPVNGVTLTCQKDRLSLARSLWSKHRVEGLGNCMAARRQVLEAAQGFDELLGLGAPLLAGEEVDLALRVLAQGHHLLHTPRVQLIHNGSHPRERLSAYVQSNLYGTGVTYAKQIKLGHWCIIPHLTLLAWQALQGKSSVRFAGGSHRRDRLIGFIRGFWRGLNLELQGQHYHTNSFTRPARG